MNKIIILFLILKCLLYGETTLDEGIKNKVEILNNQGEYEISRELLRDFIDEENKIDAMKFWISLDEKLLTELSYNTNGTLTTVEKAKKNVTNVIIKAVAWYSAEAIIPSTKLIYDKYTGKSNEYERIEEHSKSISNLKNKYITLISINKAKDILAKYDKLKKSQQRLSILLKQYIKESNTMEFKQLLPILKTHKNLKNKIKTQRTNFISYTVISPYLADAHKYIILSNDDIVGHNEAYLQKAAQQMAKGAYKNILLESNEDVREQFYNVYRALKDVAGDKELEDLKVLQTLIESSSTQKQMGADKWWE